MNQMASGLGASCQYCHVRDGVASDARPQKRRGREMMRMVSEKIGDRNAWVVTTAKARYWFDADSGLLLRRVLYVDSPIGRIPQQADVDDYRDVGGFRVPFFTRAMLVDPYLGGTRQADSIESACRSRRASSRNPPKSGAA
jgi:hypothetical protein